MIAASTQESAPLGAPSTLTPLVIQALQSLHSAYRLDELAYLALTQKLEHAIRDRLAFWLHQRIRSQPVRSQPELLVCREWRRADLAIVQNAEPRLLLEAKAIYTFDVLKSGARHRYPELLRQDLQKSLSCRRSENDSPPEVLALLLATHPHGAPAPAYRHAVKYYGNLVKYATQTNTVEAATRIVRERVAAPLIEHGEIAAGEAFGVRVSVAYWLFRAS